LDSELPKNSDVYTIKLGNISYNLLDSRITKTI
jgi:hypothetical protein